MEKKKYSEIGKCVLFYTFCAIGFIAFLILAGDEDPNNPLSFGTLFLYKFGALSVIGICIYIGKKLHAAGMLPKELDEEMEDEL